MERAQGTIALLIALSFYALGVTDSISLIPFLPMRDIFLAVAYMILLIAVSISETPLRRLFNNKIMVRLSFFSYSIFCCIKRPHGIFPNL